MNGLTMIPEDKLWELAVIREIEYLSQRDRARHDLVLKFAEGELEKDQIRSALRRTQDLGEVKKEKARSRGQECYSVTHLGYKRLLIEPS